MRFPLGKLPPKVRLGRLDVAADLAQQILRNYPAHRANGSRVLSISTRTWHSGRASTARVAHKDPFDRMLVAQAQIEGLTIVSNDAQLDGYGVSRVW